MHVQLTCSCGKSASACTGGHPVEAPPPKIVADRPPTDITQKGENTMADSTTEFATSGVGVGPWGYGYASKGFAPAEVGLFHQQTMFDVAATVRDSIERRVDIESLRAEIKDQRNVLANLQSAILAESNARLQSQLNQANQESLFVKLVDAIKEATKKTT
jgi:hypothetical protein